MALIDQNIEQVSQAIQAKLDKIPQLRFAVEDKLRNDQAVGHRILVMHQDSLEYVAGIVAIGSTVTSVRGRSKSVQPQVYYDNLLEVVTGTQVPPRYMARWLEHGCTMEPSYRQAKPESKIRLDSLASTIAQWAEVLVGLVPEFLEAKKATDIEKAQRAAEQEALLQAKALAAQLEKAREEAQERLYDQAREELLRDFGELVYNNSGRSSWNEDPVERAQRERVQAGAGFAFRVDSRAIENSPKADERPWVELDGSYCRKFSMGETRAMLEALQQYRREAPREEWLPRVDAVPEPVLEAEPDEPEEEVPMELSAAMLLGVPLPESMD